MREAGTLRLGDGFPFALIANIADRHSGLHRLGDDGQLQIGRKPRSACDAGDHFNPRERVGVRPDLSLGPPAKPVPGQNRAQFTNLLGSASMGFSAGLGYDQNRT